MNVLASTGEEDRIYVELNPDFVDGDSVTESNLIPTAFEHVSVSRLHSRQLGSVMAEI